MRSRSCSVLIAAADMLAWENGGFSIDASVHIPLNRPRRAELFSVARASPALLIELAPFEFLDRLADLIPQPRRHRHRYHGVFAANHLLRPAVTALAVGNVGKQRDAATGGHAEAGHDAGELLRHPGKAPFPRHLAHKPGPNSWPGWARSFHSNRAVPTTTAGKPFFLRPIYKAPPGT
jgi:hypothetical protein